MFQETKDKPELRNADRAREERKQRLSSQSNNDGTKKPLRKKRSLAAIITIVVLSALIIAMIVWALVSQGILNRYQKAYTVQYTAEAADGKSGSKNYSVSEANFFAGLLGDQLVQQGIFSSEGQQMLDSPSQVPQETQQTEATGTDSTTAAQESTMRDTLKQEIERQLRLDFLLSNEKVEGEQQDTSARADQLLESLKQRAASEQISFANYLSNHYGKGMNEKTFRSIFTRLLQAAAVQQSKYKSFDYDEATLKAKYDEDPAKYDVVSYRFYDFFAEEEDAKAKAEAFNDKLTDEDSFKSEAEILAKQKSDADQQQPPAADLDQSLVSNQRSIYMEPAVKDWLYSSDRQAQQHAVIDMGNGAYKVVMFLDRKQPQDPSYNSRHILLKVDANASAEEQAKVEKKAEEIKQEFEAGDKTEDSFAELAGKYSEDPGSANNGGLYEGTKKGQFVPEYEEWCLDPARQTGDVDIVKTVHGYHLIYFIKTNGPEWQDLVRNDLRDKDFREWIENLENEVEVIDAGHANKVAR